MSNSSLRPPRTPSLVDIIDLKWLMAHEGHQVHVERLQADPVYAASCLAIAAASSSAALRAAAARILAGHTDAG